MILFFHGPNGYAARAEIARLKQAYVTKTGSDLGFESIDGISKGLAELKQTLQTVPFLVTSRLILVQDLGLSKPKAEELTALLEAVPHSTVVIFFEREFDSRTTYYKTMTKLAKTIKFEPLTQPDLIAWMAKEAKRLGGSITREGAEALLASCGDDQWRISGELAKLIGFRTKVTPDSVAELVVPSVNQSIFDLTEAMTAGRGRAALATYQGLIRERVNEHYILTMVAWQLRNLLLARSAGGITPAELAKVGGLSPYVAGKAVTAARGYDESDLKAALIAAADCEYRIKTGYEPSERAVERLILDVAAQRA